MRLQSSLGVTFNPHAGRSSAAIVSTTPIIENVAEYSRLCSVICAYRLVDVLAMLRGGERAPSVPRVHFDVSSNFRV